MDEDLLCVDSLEIFKRIDEEKVSSETAIDEFLSTNLLEIQNKNEKTPSKKIKYLDGSARTSSYLRPKSSRCLFPESSGPSNPIEKTTRTNYTKNRISYKLVDIYERLYECSPKNAHNAEEDTMHLLKCAIATKDEFVRVAETLYKEF